MVSTLITVISAAFALSSTVSFLAYVPTIVDLLRRHPSANAWSYVLWSSTALTASLYAHFVLRDPLAIFSADLQTAACVTILVLRLRLRGDVIVTA